MSSASSSRDRSWRGVFVLPSVIALVSVMGLLIALMGDGLHDAIAWVALSLPLLAVLRVIVKA